jgi:hypothetical protein
MKIVRLTAVAALCVGLLTAAGCDVEKTEEGSMPDVDVTGGNMPEYDVDGPDVDVGTKTVEVEVPTVDVDLPEDDDDRQQY